MAAIKLYYCGKCGLFVRTIFGKQVCGCTGKE